ncbi:MAG: hypothetical protein Aureis2KO_10840 [Aureisphaera sp.]
MNTRKLITLTLISFLCIQCAIDRTVSPLSEIEVEKLAVFQNLESKNKIQICDENEIGQKLWLCLTVVSKESEEPIINEEIKLYHTSTAGEYELTNPADPSSARLGGTVITDEEGRVFVQTILPGDYGSSADNRHIHTTVNNARPDAYDINFEQYTSTMGRNFINGSDQHFLANLKQTKDNVLVTFLTMEVKNWNSN